jgi:hypothetical protein
VFAILPYVEQQPLFAMGGGGNQAQLFAANTQKVGTPVKLFNCPSRRQAVPYPNPNNYGYYNATGTSSIFAKTDYAACSGSQNRNETDGGPSSYAQGDTESYWAPRNDSTNYNGPFFPRSQIALITLQRGTSNTIMIGEKYLNPNNYSTGLDPSDNESMYVGMDNDIYRCTFNPPMQDKRGTQDTLRFGSAHIGGVVTCLADGSVRVVSYSVNPTNWKNAGSRIDNTPGNLD